MSKPRLGIALTAAFGALIAAVLGFSLSSRHHLTSDDHYVASAAAAGFVLLGSYSVRRFANQLSRVVARSDHAAASIVRLLATIGGVIVVILVTLAMLHIDVSQLLLGGAITGVVIGIAAQQSLGNMFAGIVLLVAHPFRAGDYVRVRTGSLGGPFEGRVESMGMTYVVFHTEEGTTMVPNLTLLGAGIVRNPEPLPPGTTVAGAIAAASAASSSASAPSAPGAPGASVDPEAATTGNTDGEGAEGAPAPTPGAPRRRRTQRPS